MQCTYFLKALSVVCLLPIPNHLLRVAVRALKPYFEATYVIAVEVRTLPTKLLIDVAPRGNKPMKHVPLLLSGQLKEIA